MNLKIVIHSMSNNPKSSIIKEQVAGVAQIKRDIVIIGQSNFAAEGIHKNIQLKTSAEINTLFGSGQHLTLLLQDAIKAFSGSFIKPQIYAISYADVTANVKRVDEVVVSGTATANGTIKIVIGSLNPDRIAVQTASALSARLLSSASCSIYTKNNVSRGLPANAKLPFNPPLPFAYTNDVVVSVSITKGQTAATIATAINTAINAESNSFYTSEVDETTLTFTAKNKGLVGQSINISFADNTVGMTFTQTNEVAGSGVTDISDVLDLIVSDGKTIGMLQTREWIVPTGYVTTALVSDAKTKWDNVTNDNSSYRNQSLDYRIWQGYSLDLSDDTELDALAGTHAIEDSGVVKTILILQKDGLKIIPISDNSIINKVEAKQFTAVQEWINGTVEIGNCYTLSNADGLIDMPKAVTQQIITEAALNFILANFQEKNYTTGDANVTDLNKESIITFFEQFYDILTGDIINDATLGSLYSAIITKSADAKDDFLVSINNTFYFDDTTGSLQVAILMKLVDAIKQIILTTRYS